MIKQFEINRTAIVEENSNGETTLVQLATARYFTLNTSASVIWNAFKCLHHQDVVQAWAQLKFIDEHGTMAADINAFINYLIDYQLLIPVQNIIETEDKFNLLETGKPQLFQSPVIAHGPNLTDLEMIPSLSQSLQ